VRIAVVGRGRLGRSLAVLLGRAGRAVELVARGGPLPPDTTLVLLCVPDDAIPAAAAALPRGPIVLHCAGALGVDVLRPHRPAGSLHPLMTFPGPEIALPDVRGVSAAVDGDPEALAAAEELARGIGMIPLRVPGDRRLYHGAAVLVGGVRVLLAEASRLFAAAGIDPAEAPAHLAPLVHAIVDHAVRYGPRAATGPSSRGDVATAEAHRVALEEHGLSDIRALYDAIAARAAGAARHHEPPTPTDES
jgi:predicted short-subunit dehydrogenase-like oxidoreductase (DUF2520 family)